MKWLVPVIACIVLVVFLGIVYVGLGMQAQYNTSVAATPVYTTPYAGYSTHGTGPEWDKFDEAKKKGNKGWTDMQALMLSTDSSVATEASNELARSRSKEAFGLLFENLDKVDATVKNALRSQWYDSDIVVAAAHAIKDKDPKTWQGGLTFINLCYMRDVQGDQAFKIVASAVPDYKGSDADKLSYTVGLFRPSDVTPLIDLLKHKEARVRTVAVTALGKMETETALPAVKVAKSDSSASVRSAAATAEKAINAAVAAAKVAASYSSYPGDVEDSATVNARTKARERLGMP